MARSAFRVLLLIVVFILGTSLANKRACREARTEVYRCVLKSNIDLQRIDDPAYQQHLCREVSDIASCADNVDTDNCRRVQRTVEQYTTFLSEHCSDYIDADDADNGDCPSSASQFQGQLSTCGNASEIAITRLKQCQLWDRVLSCVEDKVKTCSGESWMTEDLKSEIDASMENARIGQLTIGCN